MTATNLPSRRYTCIHCGAKGRRGNSIESRNMPPICPRCSSPIEELRRENTRLKELCNQLQQKLDNLLYWE